MSFLTLLLLAIGLAMDATAVAVATSVALRRVSRRQLFRFAFHFGLFQAVMPALGWAAGRSFHDLIAPWDHWIAFALLGLVGGKAIVEALRGGDAVPAGDPTRGWSLVALSIATSIDALAVGLSFAVLEVSIILPCLIIGLVTAALTGAGMVLGARLGAALGARMRLVGGVVLVAIGVQILGEHLGA